jgi:hypothetical protein
MPEQPYKVRTYVHTQIVNNRVPTAVSRYQDLSDDYTRAARSTSGCSSCKAADAKVKILAEARRRIALGF